MCYKMEESKVKITINNEINGLDTKIIIIQKLIKKKEPVSMYQFAKETNMPTSLISYHFKPLIKCGVIILYKKKYQINPCFKYSNDVMETLIPFFKCLADLNCDLDGEQLNDLAGYFLATITIEVEDNEIKD